MSKLHEEPEQCEERREFSFFKEFYRVRCSENEGHEGEHWAPIGGGWSSNQEAGDD